MGNYADGDAIYKSMHYSGPVQKKMVALSSIVMMGRMALAPKIAKDWD